MIYSNECSKRTYVIFCKKFSRCECAIVERVNKKASLTFLYTYARKFGIVSPKSPMPSTSGRGRVRCAPWKTEQLSTGELCTGKAMETHFYTAIFFSFTRFFLWSWRKIKYFFFLCPVRISRIMNAKKVVIRQGRQRAMETHLYTMDFFFSSTIIFQWTSRTIPYYFFLCLVSISRIMNEKNLEIREGRQDQWKTTCTPCNFNFLSQKLSYEHAERFPTTKPCSYF